MKPFFLIVSTLQAGELISIQQRMGCNPFEDESCLSFTCSKIGCEQSDCDVYDNNDCVTCNPNSSEAKCIPRTDARLFSQSTVYFIPLPNVYDWRDCWGWCIEERKSTEHEAFWKSSRDSIREEAKASDETNETTNTIPFWVKDKKKMSGQMRSDQKASEQIIKEQTLHENFLLHELEFQELDKNENGLIDLNEWMKINNNQAQHQQYFKFFDISKDALIDKDEFYVSQNMIKALSYEFSRIVGSENKEIYFDDALAFLQRVRNKTSEENIKILKTTDNDDSRSLSLTEFIHMNLH